MFSETGNKTWKRNFRAELKFSMIFGMIFWVTALILYAMVFVYIFSSLRDDARTGIQVRMLGYWAIDQSSGLESLKDNIDVHMILSDELPFFVRISDEFNNTVLLEVPEHWLGFNFRELADHPPEPGEFVVLRSPDQNYSLETGCIPLSGGYYLQVGMGDDNRRRVMELLTNSFMAALVILIIISTLIGILVATRFLRPIRALEHTVEDVIQTGRIENRIVERKGAGELDQLVVSFNEMLGKIESLVHGMTGALDTVAHDLRTPLTRFRMISDKALSRQSFNSDAEAAQEYRTALENAVEESDTVLRMMTLLMDISEAETGTLKMNIINFTPLERLREVVDVYRFVAEDRNISVNIIEPAYAGELTADQDRFSQAVGNLIDNAVKYGRNGGIVNVYLKPENNMLKVVVEDDGAGIDDADLAGIWKRLYRGKSSKDGLGLGLSLVRAIVKAHGGSADVRSEIGKGSVFTVEFPLTP